ncbi:MAG: hypothetical protein AB7O45_12610 [Alphaproteobacteria bacterium]
MSDLVERILRDRAAVRAWNPATTARPDDPAADVDAIQRFRDLAAASRWSEAFALAAPRIAPERFAPAMRRIVLDATAAAGTDDAAVDALARMAADDDGFMAPALYLLACASGGRTPATGLATALRWANGLMWIMDAVEPERLVAMLRPLMPLIGRWDMFADLDAMLADAPARRPGDGFLDEPHADVQLAMAPGEDARRLLVCLGGQIGRMGMPVNLFHRWAAGADRHVLYLRGPIRGDYQACVPEFGPGYGRMAAFVRGLADALAVERIGVYGNSLGGFPAACLGLAVGAHRIVVAAGTTRSVRARQALADRASERRALTDDLARRIAAAPAGSTILCLHSAGNAGDRADADALAGLAGVRAIALAGATHNVSRPLARAGALGPLLAWAAGARETVPPLPVGAPVPADAP